jgi:hypothetical protein
LRERFADVLPRPENLTSMEAVANQLEPANCQDLDAFSNQGPAPILIISKLAIGFWQFMWHKERLFV